MHDVGLQGVKETVLKKFLIYTSAFLGSALVLKLVLQIALSSIQLPNNRSIERADDLKGWIEEVTVGPEETVVSGWAFDFHKLKPVMKVVLYANDKPIGEAVPTTPRPDVTGRSGDGSALAGFQFKVQNPSVDPSQAIRYRAFALLASGEGNELSYQIKLPLRFGGK
jgi:hypothetical protein